MKDLYKTLGVAENAEEAAIKKAYRKLAKEYHPDVTGNDKKKTERFKEINEAYAVLGDAQKRKEYDRLKHAPVRPDGMPEGFDADAFARTFGGARAGGGGVEFTGDFDVGDIFASLFGGGGGVGGGRRTVQWGGRARPRQSRGADVIGQLPISFADAALGTKKTIRTGAGDAIDISVPAGVENGGRLRVPGKGAAADGKDGVPVTISEAVLGAKVEVPTVEGRVTLTIPPGTSSGARLRLRGRGVKHPDGSRGDQIVRVEIVAPKIKPDDVETRKLFEEIAARTAQPPVRRF
jgi:DnaJ-class molecular chaperone